MRKKLGWFLASAGVAWVAGAARAAIIPVPNGSFEFPTTAPPASPVVSDWSTFDPTPLEVGPGFFINDGAIIFPNTAPTSPDHISNAHDGDGNGTAQIAGIGAEAGNAFFQLLGTNYALGGEYKMTVGVARSFGQIPDSTAGLRLAFYYLDGANARQEVAGLTVVNDAATALSPNLLKDFTFTTPVLTAGHPALGKPIGVLLEATGPTGGYFDADDVRVESVPEPSVAMAAFGAAGLLLRRSRARSKPVL